jgi:RNA polymerase sigma-70 factor (ECF subfamily)
LEDRLLVQKILEKNKEAERYFFHTHRDRLYKACVYILGHGDREVEDIVQETFIAAFRNLKQFEFRSSLSHWLVRICLNRCYERIRQRQRQVVRLEEELESLSGPSSLAHENHSQEHEEKHRMMQLVETQRDILGDPCRKLLQLRDEENHSYIQLAQSLKIPIGTVMSRLARCKEALKKLVLQALREGTHA